MAEQKVGILVTAKDEASAKLKAVQKSLGDLDTTAKTSAGGVKGLIDKIGGIGVALTGVGITTAGVVALGVAIGDLTKQGLRANALQASFESLATSVGASSQQMLVGLRAASQGMISDSDLILSANRAMLLGVAQTTDEMASLLQVAAVRGQAMGLSVGQAFSDIVTGIGRMSPLILDNLGIVTGGEKVFDDYAASIGRSAASLTDMEKKQALVNSVMASTDTSVAVAVNGFAKLEASITNVTDAIGKMLASSTAINAVMGGIGDFFNAQIEAENVAKLELAQSAFVNTRDEIARLTQEISTYNEMLAQNRAAAFIADERQITDQIAANEAAIVVLTAKLPELESAAYRVADAMGKIQGPQLPPVIPPKPVNLTWGQSAFEAGAAYGKEFTAARDDVIVSAVPPAMPVAPVTKLAPQQIVAVGEGTDAAAQAKLFVAEWGAAMAGMSSSFFDSGTAAGEQWRAGFAGIQAAPTEILEPAVLGNATFAGETYGREFAAARDRLIASTVISAGQSAPPPIMTPEQGPNGRAQASTFVSDWISVLNESYPSFMAAGSGAGEQWGAGSDGGARAETFASGWVATMNKLYARFFDTGAGAGEQWGAGFMSSVEGGIPAALISLLASLVTPGVMAAFATQTSAAGAQP